MEEVVDDLRRGKHFYHGQSAEVGDYFWDSVVVDILSLEKYGGVHEHHFGFHRMLANRFPFAIYYLISDEIAFVVAVLPIKRDPAVIHAILANRPGIEEPR